MLTEHDIQRRRATLEEKYGDAMTLRAKKAMGVISTDELNKYFGKEVTPVKMKTQILALLDEWKEKQPPELGKPEKKQDMEK